MHSICEAIAEFVMPKTNMERRSASTGTGNDVLSINSSTKNLVSASSCPGKERISLLSSPSLSEA
jgi:hypothetical protein